MKIKDRVSLGQFLSGQDRHLACVFVDDSLDVAHSILYDAAAGRPHRSEMARQFETAKRAGATGFFAAELGVPFGGWSTDTETISLLTSLATAYQIQMIERVRIADGLLISLSRTVPTTQL